MMTNAFVNSKITKIGFSLEISDHPLDFQPGAPVLLAQEGVRSTPPSSHVDRRIHSKTSKMQLFQKMFESILDAQKSFRITPECSLMFLQCILESLETFDFRPFFDQKVANMKLQSKVLNIKRSIFFTLIGRICSFLMKNLIEASINAV